MKKEVYILFQKRGNNENKFIAAFKTFDLAFSFLDKYYYGAEPLYKDNEIGMNEFYKFNLYKDGRGNVYEIFRSSIIDRIEF